MALTLATGAAAACTEGSENLERHTGIPQSNDPNHPRVVAMAQQVVRLYTEGKGLAHKELVGRPPNTVRVDIDTAGPSSLSLSVDTAARAGELPDPNAVIGLDIAAVRSTGSRVLLRFAQEPDMEGAGWRASWKLDASPSYSIEASRTTITLDGESASPPASFDNPTEAKHVAELIIGQAEQLVQEVRKGEELPSLPLPILLPDE